MHNYLNPPQAAESLGLSSETIYRYIKRGVFSGVIRRGMLKQRYYIPSEEVERIRKEGNFDTDTNVTREKTMKEDEE
jgi:predicted site-specific integrase-resolvase